MVWKAVLLLLRVACLLLSTHAAAAQQVLLVRPEARDAALLEAFERLRAELELQDFEVRLFEGLEAPRHPEGLELEAQRQSAFAAIALRRDVSGTAATIWIVDRVTGKTTLRKLSIDGSRDGPTLLAIRAVDLLRASLVELDAGARPPADVLGVEHSPPPPEVVRFARTSRRFELGAGAMSLASSTLGTAFGVSLSARYRLLDRLGVGVELGGPTLGGEFRSREGSATVRQELVLACVTWNVASSSSERWEWGPRVGVGAAHLVATGRVAPPLVADTADAWSLMAHAGLGLAFYFADGVSLAADAGGVALFPQPVIALADQRSPALLLQGLTSLRLGVSF